MGQETDRIKHHIDTERERLGEQLDEVGSRVRQATDIRSRFDAHPACAAGIAFGAGMLLGSWLGTGNHRQESEYGTGPAGRRTTERYTERLGRAASAAKARAPETTQHLGQVREAIDGIFSAIIGVGAKSLRDYVADSVPGFREEYERVEANRGKRKTEDEYGTPPAGVGLS